MTHQTRQEVSKKIPLRRKGTKYVAAAQFDPKNTVPVVIAIRDMLHLARTAKEVNEMIKSKSLKINGRVVIDYRESIHLFNTLDAGKTYVLKFNPTGRFFFEETKSSERLCRVINKVSFSKDLFQLNLHDGTNILSKDKISVGDTVYLDSSNKIKRHIPLEKGRECFISSGRYAGHNAKIELIEGNKATIKMKDLPQAISLDKKGVIVL